MLTLRYRRNRQRKRVMYMAHDDLPTVADLDRYRAEGEPLALIVHQLLDVTDIAAEVISSVQMDSARMCVADRPKSNEALQADLPPPPSALSYYVKADDLDETRPGAPPFLGQSGANAAPSGASDATLMSVVLSSCRLVAAWRGGLTAVKVLDFGPTEPVPAKALALVEQRLTEL